MCGVCFWFFWCFLGGWEGVGLCVGGRYAAIHPHTQAADHLKKSYTHMQCRQKNRELYLGEDIGELPLQAQHLPHQPVRARQRRVDARALFSNIFFEYMVGVMWWWWSGRVGL